MCRHRTSLQKLSEHPFHLFCFIATLLRSIGLNFYRKRSPALTFNLSPTVPGKYFHSCWFVFPIHSFSRLEIAPYNNVFQVWTRSHPRSFCLLLLPFATNLRYRTFLSNAIRSSCELLEFWILYNSCTSSCKDYHPSPLLSQISNKSISLISINLLEICLILGLPEFLESEMALCLYSELFSLLLMILLCPLSLAPFPSRITTRTPFSHCFLEIMDLDRAFCRAIVWAKKMSFSVNFRLGRSWEFVWRWCPFWWEKRVGTIDRMNFKQRL